MDDVARTAGTRQNGAIALDMFGGRIHVEWDPAAGVTPLRDLPFFIEFFKVSEVFDAWVADCPPPYHRNHASDKRGAGHRVAVDPRRPHRDAQITAIRQDGIHPELLSVVKLVLKDTARRALARMDESSGGAWLDRHLATTTRPVLSTPWNLDLDATLKCP